MKRTQIQLDDATHAALRRRAFQEHRSLAAVIRETLATALGITPASPHRRLKDFGFVGVGTSEQGDLAPVSERHDEALAEPRRRKTRA